MAKAKKTTPKAAAPPAPPPKPVIEKIEDALVPAETILAGIEARLMSGEVRFEALVGPSDPELSELRRQARELAQEVGAFLLPNEPDKQREAGQAELAARTAAPMGEVSWSRRCLLVIWLDTIPLLCVWGGAFDPMVTTILPVVPDDLFPDPMLAEKSYARVGSVFASVEDVFRKSIEDWSLNKRTDWSKRSQPVTYTARLLPMAAATRAAVREQLANSAWLREQVRRGPVNAMQLPPHLTAVPLALAL